MFNGVTQTNGNWGEGPYGDGPPDGEDISEGGVWATDETLCRRLSARTRPSPRSARDEEGRGSRGSLP